MCNKLQVSWQWLLHIRFSSRWSISLLPPFLWCFLHSPSFRPWFFLFTFISRPKALIFIISKKCLVFYLFLLPFFLLITFFLFFFVVTSISVVVVVLTVVVAGGVVVGTSSGELWNLTWTPFSQIPSQTPSLLWLNNKYL